MCPILVFHQSIFHHLLIINVIHERGWHEFWYLLPLGQNLEEVALQKHHKKYLQVELNLDSTLYIF